MTCVQKTVSTIDDIMSEEEEDENSCSSPPMDDGTFILFNESLNYLTLTLMFMYTMNNLTFIHATI